MVDFDDAACWAAGFQGGKTHLSLQMILDFKPNYRHWLAISEESIRQEIVSMVGSSWYRIDSLPGGTR